MTHNTETLTQIAARCGTNKYGVHDFTSVYDKWFSELRTRKLTLLELGVGGHDNSCAGGLSLIMWSQYFPNAQIIGLDLYKKDLVLPQNVHLICGSQCDANVLDNVIERFGPPDIVIDDASHHAELTRTSFIQLYPRLAAHAIYAVEDLHSAFRPRLGGHPIGQETIFSLAQELTLAMHREEGAGYGLMAPFVERSARACDRAKLINTLAQATAGVHFYRNLAIFQRGDNSVGSLKLIDLAHPAFAHRFSTIQAAASAHPGSLASVSLVELLLRAGRPSDAGRVAAAAIKASPANHKLKSELDHLLRSGRVANLIGREG